MKKAFTLIEILVAMAILVIVIGSTLAIFRASSTSWRKGETRAQRYQQARFILEIMTREISSIVPSSSGGPYCLGTDETFYFISVLADAPGSLIELGYWLDQDTNELMRSYEYSPDYDFSSFDEEEALSENVSSIGFEYYDGDAWQVSWDSRPASDEANALPWAVKISFDIKDEKTEKTESFSSVISLAASAE